MKILADVVSAVLLLSGAVFCLSGAIGLLRFPDTLTRLQASAKAQSLGLVMILLGAAVVVSGPYTGLLLLIAAFQLMTAPVTGQILGRIAYSTDAVDRSLLTADELVDHKHRLRAAAASEARRETGADGPYGPDGPDASSADGSDASGPDDSEAGARGGES
ncbi:monovalent cation/H(+) antiporter subunit G [Streptomyces sp. P38-E01]|uniref:Monovalent cation/H(+) antiporter subunit G n=1 Tax=Streptomyces tardus TaxID=2780544 RepID=A0A949JG48_9ACTN|nr:monovalent cation/H(+) antiporter subunit G [Streptomyces tardus]MBU7597899.1 monovalent cation/H(+) antiporter subunit G [Streptomyces tardus]